MARSPLIAGNWKMNCKIGEAKELVGYLMDQPDDVSPVEVIVCPPFTALAAVEAALRERGSYIGLGAQDVFIVDSGAYTGMVSPAMLVDAGCSYCIVGHSERRGRFGATEPWMTPGLQRLFADSDETVNAKTKALLEAGLTPIICVGETIEERRQGQTDRIVEHQVRAALDGLDPSDVGWLVIAYEPVWAIGTGEVCEADEAQRVCRLVRDTVAAIAPAAAEPIRVLYGGSVKPDNATELLRQPDIDGALVGGASLNGESFATIVRAARDTYRFED